MLWIALKSWYLWYSEQLLPGGMGAKPRCELLSKVDIFDIRNNINEIIEQLECVVNCSQKLISLIFGTTWLEYPSIIGGCNAQKLILWYFEQPLCYVLLCCELLSKVDIFDSPNNYRSIRTALTALWIVPKSWYLWYSK